MRYVGNNGRGTEFGVWNDIHREVPDQDSAIFGQWAASTSFATILSFNFFFFDSFLYCHLFGERWGLRYPCTKCIKRVKRRGVQSIRWPLLKEKATIFASIMSDYRFVTCLKHAISHDCSITKRPFFSGMVGLSLSCAPAFPCFSAAINGRVLRTRR